MESCVEDREPANRGLRYESFSQSLPATDLHNENAIQYFLPPIDNSPRNLQSSLPPFMEYRSPDMGNSPLISNSVDLPSAPLNQGSLNPQTIQAPSSDYGDPIDYDELFGISSQPVEANTSNPPIMHDNLALSSKVETKKSGKRQGGFLADERITKTLRPNSKPIIDELFENEGDIVDLSSIETTAQWEEKKKKDAADAIKAQNQKEANKSIKLSSFQCIICMDSPTDLTITHCGHMFCSECLHQALHAGDKKCCPVCRTLVNVPKAGVRPGKNGIFSLEMKLLTSNKKGNQKQVAH
ncbi:hypothetical protein GcC1_105013 [Golovinomyces cichoracearum]|uniref:RING-type domain-containing protein n=1 Tax=Golovinomyces cichoracearum TaxID=62708 RepID=A0A420I9E8_9PEZI|nr:hypothetical protein GcC1_105013 [Golovinomyces cichoracearum]